MRKSRVKPLTAVIGGALATLATVSVADTATNPFGMQPLESGYSLIAHAHGGGEGKCGEAKCGEAKDGEGKCGEAGADDSTGEGKDGEGKCGEGKCGEGKCGNAPS